MRREEERNNEPENGTGVVGHSLKAINLSASPAEVYGHIASQPGVYIFSAGKKILYVGKARNLRKRVSSYMRPAGLDNKSRHLMERADNLRFTLTANESEALLLEQNLIKEYKPPYNILLRDDKSYPYIFVSDHADYPLITYHRGPRKRKGHYYGPYPHARLVHQSLELLHKTFRVRGCTDSFFANRSRPCLQHQIGRCSAPCVGAVDKEEYQKNVRYVRQFLVGKDSEILNELTESMQRASEELKYEEAAGMRDSIAGLRSLQRQQSAEKTDGKFGKFGNFDALGLRSHANLACVYVLIVRRGKVLVGTHHFFRAPAFDEERNLLPAFAEQYYLKHRRELPDEILAPFDWPERAGLEKQLTGLAKKKLRIAVGVRGVRKEWLEMAQKNCTAILDNTLNQKYNEKQVLSVLQKMLNITELIERIECFDISHSSGEAAQAACVVRGPEGAQKQFYRRYNLDDITPGDDYAAMEQAIARRYKKVATADHADLAEADLPPQILLIDGGRGQLNRVLNKAEDLGLRDMLVIAVAKGKQRKFGRETFYIDDRLTGGNHARVIEYAKESTSPELRDALKILLRIRDEAHRFALRGHTRKRDKSRMGSVLDRVKGLGEERQKTLLRHFGGIEQVKKAGVGDLVKVPGFGKTLATAVFERMHK